MVNPKSGHTAANITLGVDGLRDGDVITSPSLTNLLEGLHGNGIIRLQDGARAQANRNEVMTNAPGHCVRATASTLTVHGGYAVLDGCLYAFAGGAGASVTLTLENTQNYVSSTALSSGEEVLYVIYLVGNSNAARSSSRVRVLGGTPTTTTTGVFPPVPDGFLTDPITGLAEANSQTIVLAVVRAIYKSSGGGNDNIDIVEVNDKRTFIHNTPHYFTPLTTRRQLLMPLTPRCRVPVTPTMVWGRVVDTIAPQPHMLMHRHLQMCYTSPVKAMQNNHWRQVEQ